MAGEHVGKVLEQPEGGEVVHAPVAPGLVVEFTVVVEAGDEGAGELVDRARTLCRRASLSAPVVLDADDAPTTATDRPVFRSPAMVALVMRLKIVEKKSAMLPKIKAPKI